MALTQVTGPYPIFTDLDGSPLDDGYLYIGAANQDPETNPIQVFWDSALTIPATQPIRTNNGYAWRNGTPGLLYTATEFSITIRNKRNEFVLYSPLGYGFDPKSVSASVVKNDFIGDGIETDFTLSASPSTILATNIFINGVYQEKDSYSLNGNVITFSIAPPLSSSIEILTNETGVINGGNANDISYTLTAPGATLQTVQTKLEQYISVKDFGAVGDGVVNDTAAVQAALDYALSETIAGNNVAIYVPTGVYRCGALSFDPISTKGSGRITIFGDYGASVLLSTVTGTSNPFFAITKYGGYGAGNDWTIDGIHFKSNVINQGIGLYFEALNWQTTVKNCIFENFFFNYQNLSGITPRIENCRFMGGDVGFFLATATTGNPALDQIPANLRVFSSYFGGQGDGTGGSRVGMYGGPNLGLNAVIDECVFEGNTEVAIANLGRLSAVRGSWFEKVDDVISGEFFQCTLQDLFSVHTLFVSSGASLLPQNRNIFLNVGYDPVNPPYGNTYENQLNQLLVDRIEFTENVFCGVGSTGITTPVDGQGHFESTNPPLILRNSQATAGKWWQTGPDGASSAYTVYNQNSVGVYLPDGQTAWVANSDERLKTLAEPIGGALAKLAALRTVYGRYNSDSEDVRRLFLVAQDVEKVLPEAVDKNAEGYLGVKYTDLIPVLISAVNELAALVASKRKDEM